MTRFGLAIRAPLGHRSGGTGPGGGVETTLDLYPIADVNPGGWAHGTPTLYELLDAETDADGATQIAGSLLMDLLLNDAPAAAQNASATWQLQIRVQNVAGNLDPTFSVLEGITPITGFTPDVTPSLTTYTHNIPSSVFLAISNLADLHFRINDGGAVPKGESLTIKWARLRLTYTT